MTAAPATSSEKEHFAALGGVELDLPARPSMAEADVFGEEPS